MLELARAVAPEARLERAVVAPMLRAELARRLVIELVVGYCP